MKVVLLHDWLTGYRGGEKVLEALCELFPKAPLYTLIYVPGSTTDTIENRKIVSSFLSKVPGIGKHYRKLLPFFPIAARSLEIEDDVDLVISTSHCVIKGVNKKNAKHLCYIHSPMRYIYDQFDAYFGPRSPIYQRLGMMFFRKYLTRWDISSNENVDLFLPNSNFVRKRIIEYYQRDGEVVHPFVDLSSFTRGVVDKREDFYLMVGAFAPNKRVDLAVEAFNENGKKLIIVGTGQNEEDLKNIANENIIFLGKTSWEKIIDLYYSAKGFIFPGVEDFGITPLEAMASGLPIIAYKGGGVLETLTDETAEFFEEASVNSLNLGIDRFEKRSFDREKLIQRAEEFSKDNFKKNIMDKVKKLIS